MSIADNIIAAILYKIGQDVWNEVNGPLQKAIKETAAHFSKNENVEFDHSQLEAIIKGDVGKEELEKFRSGESFIEGTKLAQQFAIYSGFYIEDERRILSISEEIFAYFKGAFELALMANPKTFQETLHRILKIEFDISHSDHKKLADEVGHIIQKIDEQARKQEHERKIIEKYEDFKIVTPEFWEQARTDADFDHFYLYYTHTDSSPVRLLDVVAHDYYIVNEQATSEFDNALSKTINEKTTLIKILSRGGEGKSTFLYHIAKKYSDRFNVVMVENISSDVLAQIEIGLGSDIASKPILLLLDNPSIYSEALVNLAPKIVSGFRNFNLTMVITEREFRYSNIEDIDRFEHCFQPVIEMQYRAQNLRAQIFEKLFSLLTENQSQPESIKSDAYGIYIEDSRKSISECTFSLINYLRTNAGITFEFDWEDWARFSSKSAPGLQRLYLVIATFYQFGFNLPITFAAEYLPNADHLEIISILGSSNNLPIYRRGRHLYLRHETLASWFIDYEDDGLRKNQESSEIIFRDFLDRINTEFDRNLLIWLYKSKDFQESYLTQILTTEKYQNLIKKYIGDHPNELKCRTELGKIYQHQDKYDEAERILLESLEIDNRHLHARTELAKIYQHQDKYDEAERILLESLEIDNRHLHARTELAKIYQHQDKY
ncbi:MAG: tetratricopeptide repeat protein, partial [FCB group bacterium]|nr:tetratricopeptide repeat protein [FCB group bacterium]